MNPNACAFLLDRHLDGAHGARTAISGSGVESSYVDIAKLTHQAANRLRRLGVRPEQRVVLHLNDSQEFVVFFLATLRLGAVAVPVNTFCDAEDLTFYLNDTRASVLVTHSDCAGKSLAAAARSVPLLEHIVYVEDPVWRDESTVCEAFHVCADDSAFWLYTSGSTGTPKAVMHSHAATVACSEQYARDVLQISDRDRIYSTSKLFFAYGLGNSLIFPFAVGASCVLNPARSDAATVLNIMRQHRPTLFFAVPTLYHQLLAAPELSAELFASVRMCVSAGEPLPALVFEQWLARTGQRIYDGIGSTEAMHIFCSNRPDAVQPGTSGRPVAGYELKLVDEDGRPVPVAQVGRLLVRGKTVAKGYWNRSRQNQLVFQGEWLATGDMYEQRADGYFRYIGRQDDVFKSSGLWISPNEVEQALLSHPYVKEAAVVAGKNAAGLTVAMAFIVLKEAGASASETSVRQELQGYLAERLSKYKVPAMIECLPELPKTATGKVARATLRCREQAPADSLARAAS